MSEALKFLVDKGYVHLSATNDKRSHQLVLTEAGQKAMSAGSVLEAERLSALLSVLSGPEIMKALEGLELLAAATFKLTLKQKEER